jgi:hypothetical protein
MTAEPMKICSKCGPPAQPLSNFGRNRTMRDGHQAWCRKCKKEYNQEHPHPRDPVKARAAKSATGKRMTPEGVTKNTIYSRRQRAKRLAAKIASTPAPAAGEGDEAS